MTAWCEIAHDRFTTPTFVDDADEKRDRVSACPWATNATVKQEAAPPRWHQPCGAALRGVHPVTITGGLATG